VLTSLSMMAAVLSMDAPYRLDATLPPPPAYEYQEDADGEVLLAPQLRRMREVGTSTTIFVNFDGVDLGSCNPSSSKRNCHWYNNDKPFEPFSGSMQIKVSVLQAMRRKVADFGIRVTGVRPADSEDYTMVVYGGTEAEYGALGSAPAGDCLDQKPNEIVFAHLDGELVGWINGGATTALHEAAHSWGLDHIDVRGGIMFPSGDDTPTAFRMGCDQVVSDTSLTPGDGSCPTVNTLFCPSGDLQDAHSILTHLFGPPYVDITPPSVELVHPRDGQYFQGPASFDVVFDIDDDLHPQAYTMTAWLNDDERPANGTSTVEPGFAIKDLPIGHWDIHVVIADQARNETRIDFSVVVGEDPPPEPSEGCSVARGSTPVSGIGAVGWLCVLVLGASVVRRRQSG
jgi:hypothetical protein